MIYSKKKKNDFILLCEMKTLDAKLKMFTTYYYY